MVKIQPTHTPAGESHKAVRKLAERQRGAPAGGRAHRRTRPGVASGSEWRPAFTL